MARQGIVRLKTNLAGVTLDYPVFDSGDLPVGRAHTGLGGGFIGEMPSLKAVDYDDDIGIYYSLVPRARVESPDGTRFLVPFVHCPLDYGNPPWRGFDIASIIQVEFAGLGGDFADWNGIRLLTRNRWRPSPYFGWDIIGWNCYLDPLPFFRMGCVCRRTVEFGAGARNTYWEVEISSEELCSKRWRMISPEPSLPEGNYAEFVCWDTDCIDGASCEDSVGATCVVSLANPLDWDD